MLLENSVSFIVTAERRRAGSEDWERESGGKDRRELAVWEEVGRDPQSLVIHHQMNKPHITLIHMHTHRHTQADMHKHICAHTEWHRLCFADVRTHHCQSFVFVLLLKRKDKPKLEADYTVCYSLSFTVIGSFLCSIFFSVCVAV